MAGTSGNLFANFMNQAASGNINWASHAINLALLSSSYTYSSANLTSEVYWSDVSADEVTGTGYTAGGQALTSKTSTVTSGASWGTSWAASTAYTVGQVVRPATANNYLYMCVVAGTSGSSAPTFPTVVGQDVTDGGVTWSNIGESITVWNSAAVTWSSSTITASYGVLYDANTGTSTTEPLIAIINFGGSQSSSSGNFTITPSSQGWFFTTAA